MNNQSFFCDKCGTPLTSNERFCKNCGSANQFYNNFTPSNVNNQVNSMNNINESATLNNMNMDQNNGFSMNNVNNQNAPMNNMNAQFNNTNAQNLNIPNSKPTTNKSATYSLVCGIVAFFIFWWLSFVGIGLAIKALREIKTSGEKGKGLAVAGIIISVIDLILYFV